MVKDTRVHVHMRIDFAGGASVGPGKIALLERIVVAGSLSQAARDLGLSYRRGWLLLNDLNQSFGEPVVVTATGGAHGGGAQLTPLGHQLIERYRKAELAAQKAVGREFRKIAAAGPGTAGGSLRRPLSRPLKATP